MDIESRRRYRREHKRTPAGSLVTGLLIVTVGLTLLANNLGWADARHFLHQFWPFLLMAGGAALLLARLRDQSPHSGSGFWGAALLVSGLWAYADQRGWIHVSLWAVIGPTFLVLLGGSFVWRAFHQPNPDAATDGYLRSVAVLSGTELRPTTTPFKGGELTAVMGGVVLNLTGAQMEGDSATLDVFSVMGGIEIFVPRDWKVVLKVGALMGGCLDTRKPSALPASKTLVIRGFALLGGIEIKD